MGTDVAKGVLMIRRTFEKAMPIGDARKSRRLVNLRRVILLSVLCALASLAVAMATPASAASFANTTPITIRDDNTASPYPSEIVVSGTTGPITDVSVTLNRFGHTNPGDVDILLVSPSGKGVVLMSDACASADIEDFTWTFSDSAPGPMTGDCSGFTYRPTNNLPGFEDFWPSPAPGGPYSNNLGAFDNEVANGAWELYVLDEFNQNSGDIEGGWSMSIQTGPVDMATQPPAPQALRAATRPPKPSRARAARSQTWTSPWTASGTRTRMTSICSSWGRRARKSS
jgi:subtilisin-like proprotein convertase family protein